MDKNQLEGLKEIGRWIVLYVASFVVSWFISETLNQIVKVPESFNLKLWVFVYAIPIRQMFTLGLTFVGRFVDKYLHELGKETDNDNLKSGLTRF